MVNAWIRFHGISFDPTKERLRVYTEQNHTLAAFGKKMAGIK
jgi:hypothetical protein